MLIDNIENDNIYKFNLSFREPIPIPVQYYEDFDETQSGIIDLIESSWD